MNHIVRIGAIGLVVILVSIVAAVPAGAAVQGAIPPGVIDMTVKKVAEKTGSRDTGEIKRGVSQVALFWRESDGTADEFTEFCCRFYAAAPEEKKKLLARFESNLEMINGHLHEIDRFINEPVQLDQGPILPVDRLFAEYSPYSHLLDDYFKTKIAFVTLLNFPLTTLDEKLRSGPSWSRKRWAEVRLAEGFDVRIPAEVSQKVSSAYVSAEAYISSYNIFMNNLLTPGGERLFPKGLKLISHWGLRDELKGQYKNRDGLKRQEMIVTVMERIITQQIPRQVINDAAFDWEPESNRLFKDGREVKGEGEDDARYRYLKKIFQASLLVDPYYPAYPTHIKRSFESEREIPEKALEAHLVALITSPPIRKTAKLIEKQLGRPLRPFDIWYDGFRSTTAISEDELDRIVGARYPDCASFQRDLPDILMKLGFSKEKALFLAERIQVDPSRGAGHAMGAGRRGDKAHLRTRLVDGRFNYKGFNIALHELGHTVEQVFSLYCVDNTLLSGVPNTAFTEAFAFVFQSRDMEVLGLEKADPRKDQLRALDTLWDTYELAGVALTDMKVWHWMYDHPDATEAQLKEAVIGCAKEVWNTYYAPVMGGKDVALFAIYSHMIESGLYLPNYPIGHIVQFQLEDHLRKKGLGTEMERMCSCGRVTPDLWMHNALGTPISTKPLIEESEKALKAMGE